MTPRLLPDTTALAASSAAGVAAIPLIPHDAQAWQVLVAVALLGLTGALIRLTTTGIYRTFSVPQAIGAVAAGPFASVIVSFLGWRYMLEQEGLFLATAGVFGYLGASALDYVAARMVAP